ncbi:MAG TPA: carboxyl transferase domain-containing protein, partial [Casimicrobiaceae bacterium]|nr:carboxyl transferase domain-containing protein [Casimicrobiaceae bacterium]
MNAGNSLPSARLRSLQPLARIAALADPGSVVPLETPRASPWLARFGIAAQADDGVATARLTLEGKPVLAAAQDERFVGGSIGARHGEALEGLFRRAIDERPAAVILLMASGGVRLFEANAAELAASRALRALLDARAAGVAVVAVGIGDVFGGASVIACAGASLAMLPSARIGLSGPRVIETARGCGEVDASDTAAVEALFGARARAAAGDVVLVDDDAPAVRAWLASAIRDAVPFEAQVLDTQARLAARSAGVVAPVPRPLLFTGRARVDAADAGGYTWRVDDALVTAPFTGRAFDGASVHALDSALLGTVTEGPMPPIVVTEDSTGHDVSRAAEARFDSRLLAHHAAVLAYLRQRGA